MGATDRGQRFKSTNYDKSTLHLIHVYGMHITFNMLYCSLERVSLHCRVVESRSEITYMYLVDS